MKTKQFNIRIEEKMHDDLKLLSRLQGKSMAEIIEHLLKKEIDTNREQIEMFEKIVK